MTMRKKKGLTEQKFLYQDSKVWKRYIFASTGKVTFKNDLYTAGIFWDESYYEREKRHDFTRFLQN